MMPISRSSDYAIRAMTYLAHQETGRLRLARDIAQDLSIPAPFLGKVLQPLVGRGMLASRRGRKGGFRLARPASEITLFAIVDAEEHISGPRLCFLGQSECTDERACPMHAYWKEAHSAFLERLSETTLADLVRFGYDRPGSGYPATSPESADAVRLAVAPGSAPTAGSDRSE